MLATGPAAAAPWVAQLAALAASPGRLRTALQSDEARALGRVLRAGRHLLRRLGGDAALAAQLRAPDTLLAALLRLDFEAAARLGDAAAVLWAALDPEGVRWLEAQRAAGGREGARATRLLEQLGAPRRPRARLARSKPPPIPTTQPPTRTQPPNPAPTNPTTA